MGNGFSKMLQMVKNKKYIKEELKLDVDLTKVENLKLKNLYEDVKKELENIK